LEERKVKKTETLDSVDLYVYPDLKQGDAWCEALQRNKGDVVKALLEWASMLEDSAKGLRGMAEVLEGHKGVGGFGGTHVASIRDIPSEITHRVILASDGLAVTDQDPENEDQDAE
jgi:hypothetical protein